MNERVNAILNFWFVDSSIENWFKKDNKFDNIIKQKFQNDYFKAINNELEEWQDNPESCLALIILLDQFSRNIYRDNLLAFHYDYKTRLIVNEAIDRGDLENIEVDKRLFLILPLIHSENISDHIFANKLLEVYLKNHPNYNDIKKQFMYHTIAIKKFGRYPHRNNILKRESTSEEKKFLSKANSSW